MTVRLAPPRVLVESGARSQVHEALCWGLVERMEGSGRGHDIAWLMWGGPHVGEHAVRTEMFGFSLEQLEETRRALEHVIDGPEFAEQAKEECRRALEIVARAEMLLGKRPVEVWSRDQHPDWIGLRKEPWNVSIGRYSGKVKLSRRMREHGPYEHVSSTKIKAEDDDEMVGDAEAWAEREILKFRVQEE